MFEDDRSIESLRNRIAKGYEGVDPKKATLARSSNAGPAAQAAQQDVQDQLQDNAVREYKDGVAQQRQMEKDQAAQQRQQISEQKSAVRAQAQETKRQQAVAVRQGAAAGMETTTDIETGRRSIATNDDGTPKFKTGPVGEPYEQVTQEAALSSIPGYGGVFQLGRPAEEQTLTKTSEVVQDYRNAHGEQITAAPEGQKTDAKGNITITKKDDYGRDQQVQVGTDPAKAKTAELKAKADAAALRKNQIAQARLQFDAEYTPIKEELSAAEKRLKALPPFEMNAAGQWVRISRETGEENPVTTEALARFEKEKKQADDQMAAAKRKADPYTARQQALDAAEEQVKQDHLRLEAERIKHEMRLPDADGGVSKVLAEEATGDNPYGKFLKEFGIGAQDAYATPEEQAQQAQEAKERALIAEAENQPLPADKPRIPANQSAQQALGTLKDVEGLTVRPDGAVAFVHGPDGKWIATVEPDRKGGTALTLRDDASSNQSINNLLRFDKAGNELPLYIRENVNRPTLRETAQWAAQVHTVLLPDQQAIKDGDTGETTQLPNSSIMLGGDGAASAGSTFGSITATPNSDAERGKLLEQLGATPDQIKRKVANGEIPMQVGRDLLKTLYNDTLVPDNFDDPSARQKWIEETTKKEIAAGVSADMTTAARWKQATAKSSSKNLALGPLAPMAALWSTYSLSEQNELERDRVADYALKNLGKPGVRREDVQRLYDRDAADNATITERINSMATAMGKTGKYDAGASSLGLIAGLVKDGGAAEVAMIGKLADQFGITNATGEKAAQDFMESMGLRNRDFANFIDGSERNLKKWFTPDGLTKAAQLDQALATLKYTIDEDQQASVRNPDAVRAAELQVRNAALALHGLAPDESWPITADSLDPDKDVALGSALARYAATADPRQMDLYKARLLMSNGRRQFSAAIEQKTQGRGRAAQSFIGAMSAGWQEIGTEIVADASFALTGGLSTAAMKSLKTAQVAGTTARVGRIGRGAMAITEAAAKWEQLGVKVGTLAKPLTAGERFSNLVVKGGKLVFQGSVVGEPLEEVAVELGADDPNFGQAYLGGMMGSAVMLPVFAGISKVAGAVVAAPEQAKFERQIGRWTQHYNTTYAGTPGFTPITPEVARTASQLINPKASGSHANRMVAAMKLLGLTEEQVTITPDEQAAAATSQQRVAEGAAAVTLDEKTRTNLESEAARLQRRIEQDDTSDQTGTGALKPDRRAALEEQLAEINSRLGDSQAAQDIPSLQAQNAETDPAIQQTNVKMMLQQVVEHHAGAIAEAEVNAVDAVNAIAAETDPARKTFMQGIAKVASGNAHLLTNNERRAIQGTTTESGAAYFDSTVDPTTGQVTENITPEGAAELADKMPAIGRLIQTPESMALYEQATSPQDTAVQSGPNVGRIAVTPEHQAAADQVADQVAAKIAEIAPQISDKVTQTDPWPDRVTGGVATVSNENTGEISITIIPDDIAQAIAKGADPAKLVEELTDLAILHETLHALQFKRAADAGVNFAEYYTAFYNEMTPQMLAYGRELYGEANWDTLKPHQRAAEVERMFAEAAIAGRVTDIHQFTQGAPPSILARFAEIIKDLIEAITTGAVTDKNGKVLFTLPASFKANVDNLVALHKELLNAPANTNTSTANPAVSQQQSTPGKTGDGTGGAAKKTGDPQAAKPGTTGTAPSDDAGAPPAAGPAIPTNLAAARKLGNERVAAALETKPYLRRAPRVITAMMDAVFLLSDSIADLPASEQAFHFNAEIRKALESPKIAEQVAALYQQDKAKKEGYQKARQQRINEQARKILNSDVYKTLSAVFQAGNLKRPPLNALQLKRIKEKQKNGPLSESEMEAMREMNSFDSFPTDADMLGHPIAQAIRRMLLVDEGQPGGLDPDTAIDGLDGPALWTKIGNELESLRRGYEISDENRYLYPDMYDDLDDNEIAALEAQYPEKYGKNPEELTTHADFIERKLGDTVPIAKKVAIARKLIDLQSKNGTPIVKTETGEELDLDGLEAQIDQAIEAVLNPPLKQKAEPKTKPKELAPQNTAPKSQSAPKVATPPTPKADPGDMFGGASQYRDETREVPPGSPMNSREVKDTLAPYLMSGNKGDIVGQHGNFILRLAKGAARVLDTFGGAAIYSHFLAKMNALPKGSQWNEWTYTRTITNRQIAANPSGVAMAVAAIHAQYRQAFPEASLPATREGMLEMRQQIYDWVVKLVRDHVGENPQVDAEQRLILEDSPYTAALYLYLQNHAQQNRVVDFSIKDGQVQITNADKIVLKDDFDFIKEDPTKGVVWTSPSRVTAPLQQLGPFLEAASARLKQVEVTQQDGWQVATEAPDDSLVFVDPSYFAGDKEMAEKKKVMNYGGLTEEDGNWRTSLAKIREFLVPNGERVRYVFSNNFNSNVVEALEQDGWTVLRTTRNTSSGPSHELIALSPAAARAAGIGPAPARQFAPGGFSRSAINDGAQGNGLPQDGSRPGQRGDVPSVSGGRDLQPGSPALRQSARQRETGELANDGERDVQPEQGGVDPLDDGTERLASAPQDATRYPDESGEAYYDRVKSMKAVTFPESRIVYHQTGDRSAAAITAGEFKSGKDVGLAERRGGVYFADRDVNEGIYARTGEDEAHEGQQAAWLPIDIKGLKLLHTGYTAPDGTFPQYKLHGAEKTRGEFHNLPPGFDGFIDFLSDGRIYEVALPAHVANKARQDNRLFSAPQATQPDVFQKVRDVKYPPEIQKLIDARYDVPMRSGLMTSQEQWDDLERYQKIEDNIAQRIYDYNLQTMGDKKVMAFAKVRYPLPMGVNVAVIHPSVQIPGKWQITKYTTENKGATIPLAWGHHEADSKEEAIAELSGVSSSYYNEAKLDWVAAPNVLFSAAQKEWTPQEIADLQAKYDQQEADVTANFKKAFTPLDPKNLFGDWGTSLREDNIVIGYRGENGNGQADNGFGASEGQGLYIAKSGDDTAFFGKARQVSFPTPKNPVVVDEDATSETLPLLNEEAPIWEDILAHRVPEGASNWIKAHVLAAKKVGFTEDTWGEKMDDFTRALTDELLAMGHDAVYVRSAGMEWVVILAKAGKRYNRGTRSKRGTSLYSAPQTETDWFNQNSKHSIHINLRGNAIDPARDLTGWVLPVESVPVPLANTMNTRYGKVGAQAVLVPKEFVTTSRSMPDKIKPGFRPSPEQVATITQDAINPNGTVNWAKVFLASAPKATPQTQYAHKFLTEKLAKTGSLTPQEHQQLIAAEKAIGQAHAFDLDDPSLKSLKRGTITKGWQPNLMLEMEIAYGGDDAQMRLFSAADQSEINFDNPGYQAIDPEVIPANAPSRRIRTIAATLEEFNALVKADRISLNTYIKIARKGEQLIEETVQSENLSSEAVVNTINSMPAGGVGRALLMRAFVRMNQPEGYIPVFDFQHGVAQADPTSIADYWNSKPSYGRLLDIVFVPESFRQEMNQRALDKGDMDHPYRIAWTMKTTNPYYVRMAARNEIKAIFGKDFVEQAMRVSKTEFLGKPYWKRANSIQWDNNEETKQEWIAEGRLKPHPKNPYQFTALHENQKTYLKYVKPWEAKAKEIGMTLSELYDAIRNGGAAVANKLAALDSPGRKEMIRLGRAMGPFGPNVKTTGTLFPMEITTQVPVKRATRKIDSGFKGQDEQQTLFSAPQVTLTREVADKIATDLIEGGINAKWTVTLTAEGNNVPISAVQSVKKYLLKHGPRLIDSQADMILKGWDDDQVGVGKTFGKFVKQEAGDDEQMRLFSATQNGDFFNQLDATPQPTRTVGDTQAREALTVAQRPQFGILRGGAPRRVSIRLDLPSARRGTAVMAIHEPGIGKIVGYDVAARLSNANFRFREAAAQKIRDGEARAPIAAVDGTLVAIGPDVKLEGEGWEQVRYNPNVHSYFFTENGEGVLSAPEVVQIGTKLYVRKPVKATAAHFLFSAPQVTPDIVEAALAPLSPMYRQVFQASQANPTPAPDVLARRFSISETAVNNIIGQVRTRIRTLSESQQTGGLSPVTRDGLLVPGRPERAMSTNPIVGRAQQIRAEEDVPVVIGNEQTYRTARQMIAEDRQGTLEKLISRRANGETMTLEEVAAAQLFLRELGPQDTDPKVRLQLAWLASDWIDQGTDDARRLQIRRDVTHNPAERLALYFKNFELTPQDAKTRKSLSEAKTRAAKEAVLQKWFAKVDGIKAKLKADGIDIDASMAALDAKLKAQRQAVVDASVRHSSLVRSLQEDAARLQREADALRAQIATAQGDTAAARRQAAEAEQRAQEAAGRVQEAAALDPAHTLRLELEALPLSHRAAIENIGAGGTLDTAAMIAGTTPQNIRKIYEKFRNSLNEAGLRAAKLAQDIQLGRLASASLASAPGVDYASAIGWPTLSEVDRVTAGKPPRKTSTRKTAPVAKVDPPMMSDEEFARRIANPVTPQETAQGYLLTEHQRAMAKLPPGKRITLEQWIAKLPAKRKSEIQQDLGLKTVVGGSTNKALPTDNVGLLDFTDPESVKNAVQTFANETGTVMDSLLDFRRMAILSGFQTSLVNTTSAAMLGAYFQVRRPLEAAVNAALRPFGIRSDKAATFSEFPALAKALPNAAAFAVRHMVTAWKLEDRDVDSAMLGIPTQMGLGGGGWHHEAVTKGRFVGNFIKLPIPTANGIKMVSAGDIMRGLTYRQMTASDSFLTAFNGHIGAVAHAHRIAAIREKLTGAAYDARMEELMLPGSEAMVHGFREGTRSTSTQPLGKSQDGFKSDGRPEALTAHHTIDVFVDTVANLVNQGRKKRFGDMRDIFPFLLDLSAPFVVTPANLYKEAARLTPFVNLGLAGIDALRAWHTLYGNEGRAHPEIAKQRAKQIWDSYRTIQEVTNQIISLGALYLIASYAAGSGDEPPLITGTEPWKQTDREARDTNSRVMKPMSIRIPGTDITFSYARMDPFATAIASTIDMVQNHKMGLPYSEQFARFFTSQKNQVKEKTMLDGLSRIFEAIEAPDRNAERYLADLAVSMVPNMVRQPMRELDPYVRDTATDPTAGFVTTVADRAVKGLLPMTAPAKLDAYGKPVERRPPGKPLIAEPVDRLLSVIDPTHMARLPNAQPLDRYLFRYNQTVKPEDRIGIGPIDNHVVTRKDGKETKLPITAEERQEATARAAERALKFLGDGWESKPVSKEGAERIVEIIGKFQKMETERLRNEKLRKAVAK